MNSYERVLTALARRVPDRVPVVEFAISPGIVRQIHPEAGDQVEFAVLEDLDAVCCTAQYLRVSECPDGSYTDEWGVAYKPSTELIDHPIRGPVQSWADLKAYCPPDPDLPHRFGRLPELVARFKGKKAIVFLQRAAFMGAAFLNGLDNLLMNFLADPEFAHVLMDKVLAANIRMARNAIRAGADIITLGDDYAGNKAPMFSPKVFREFVQPRLKRMVDAIHEEGAKVIKHSDGNLYPILEDLVAAGMDAINPLEPIAGMDIADVKSRYGDRVCLVGNIDCSHLLSEGTVEEVEAAVRECIRVAAPGGGYIVSSSNSIHTAVKPANFLAMVRAARRYGSYPLAAGLFAAS